VQARGIGRGRSVVAGGEHDNIGSDRMARGKTQRAVLDCHHTVVQRLQRAWRRVQQVPQIGAIQPARYESRFGRPHAIQQLWRLARQPVEEVVWLIGKRAHAAGGHVQQVVGVAGRIGETRTERRFALDQRDARAWRHVAEQVPAE
jgi:hypothetical protein